MITSDIQESINFHSQKIIHHYRQSLNIDPDSATTHEHLGNIYNCLQDHEKSAIHYLQSLRRISYDSCLIYSKEHKICYPRRIPLIYKSISVLNFESRLENSQKKHNIQQIINIIQKKNIYDETKPILTFLLGYCYAQLGDFEQAKEFYGQANSERVHLRYPQIKNQKFTPSRPPNFLIPGFWKSGTSFLYFHLIQHPQILPSLSKESHYFSQFPTADLDYYLAYFPAFGDTSYMTGEASCDYIVQPDLPQKIKHLFPEIKLIILLRNPIERAISQWYLQHQFRYQYFGQSLKNVQLINIDHLAQTLGSPQANHLSTTISGSKKFQSRPSYDASCTDDLIEDLFAFIRISLYINYLPAWFKEFPKEQILILKSEDLFAHPADTMRHVHNFLGLPDHILTEYPKINASHYPPITPSLRKQLAEFFQPYNEQLEEFLGRKFDWQ